MYMTLAQVYDDLMKDIHYDKMADFIESIFRKYSLTPSLVLDLGCGTGSLSLVMMARNYDMIGIDNAPDMLERAANKAAEQNKSLLLLLQDIQNFELYGTVGAILATMDVLNHLTKKKDLLRTFQLVHNYLDPGGLFLFDLNSPYKLETLLPKQSFYEVGEKTVWLWNSHYSTKTRICRFDLTFFIQATHDAYNRYDEVQQERAWSQEEVQLLLQQAGLVLEAVYDGWSFKKPNVTSERFFFVVRKMASVS